MPYTAPTLTQAQVALAGRLEDPGMVRWVPAELTAYLKEALRVWNAFTAHWRAQASFSSTMLQPFYDLPTVLPTLRGYTVTNWDLIADLQYSLLEPAAPGGTWTGTEQFSIAKLNAAITQRLNQFQRETGAVVTYTPNVVNGVVLSSGRVPLPEDMLIVRRATWRVAATQTMIPLTRSDEWGANKFQPLWPSAGTTQQPFGYSTSVTPPLTFQLFPPPPTAGSLDLVTINKAPAIDPLVNAPLGIPDDWVWVVKYGALADLLQSDGLVLDPSRSAYCETRWKQGIEMAAKQPVVLTARINGVVTLINALSDLDSYQPLWQLVGGVPREVGLSGGNLLCTVPPANSSLHTLTLDVVQNAPMPVFGVDVLQIGADVYDAILDYAQHVALFKEGGGPLETAVALLQRFAADAGVELAVQQASQPLRRPLVRQQTQDEAVLNRVEEPVPAD